MRKLAEIESTGAPVITAYLDMRPEATGQNPQVRSGRIVLRDRLRELRRPLEPRGQALESFNRDAERMESFVDNEMNDATEGLAMWACDALGLWETAQVETPFENQVSVGPHADLYQLARLRDEFETSVVALVDSNTARLFVYRGGALAEGDGVDDEDEDSYHKTSVGGWSQARYQRHVDKHRKDFAEETAAALTETVHRNAAGHVVIAGDAPALTWLEEALPRDVLDKVEDVAHIDIHADRNEIYHDIAPLLRDVEAQLGQETVERFVGEARRDGTAAVGLEGVRAALERGQVDTLLIDHYGPLDQETRADLVRQAANTGARLEVVERNDALQQLGGVGALLRYKI